MAKQGLLGWHYNDSGIYTVKSGYWLATHLPNQEIIQPTYGNTTIKKKLWKTQMPSKIHHFLWKASSRSLPKGSNLKRRHVTNQDQCCRCCSSEETEKHILFDCPYAQQIWRASGISNMILTDTSATLEEMMEACLQ
ncbi:hypothetical protein Bca52824_046078 [Brassica carinata]|uniref:Reverse transcriptase zinc-binding domain-containing protein n=1 Tax=Brassica carinata TaxID=52824 RepID=A0A8X7RC83_BRACI|nr:hypothetical protein Bca52824_046078 [Brassica carinata]